MRFAKMVPMRKWYTGDPPEARSPVRPSPWMGTTPTEMGRVASSPAAGGFRYAEVGIKRLRRRL